MPLTPVLAHLLEQDFHIDMLVPDSAIHRFKRHATDKKKDAWYVCHQAHSRRGDLFFILTFGDWKDGESRRFNTLSNGTKDDNTYILDQINKAEKKRKEEQEKVWLETAEEAALEIETFPADGLSQYLIRKQVKSYGLRYNGDEALVPVQDATGKVWGYQRLTESGKYFLAGCKVKGNFFVIGAPTKDVILCEGYATGASLHEATGLQVVVAFMASNMPEVSRLFSNVIVCADNDPNQVGRRYAEKCNAVKVIYPEQNDFNDLHVAEGLDAVRRLVLQDEQERQFVTALGHKGESYYYTSSSNRQIVTIPRASHNQSNLIDIMPTEYWAARFPHATKGCDWGQAANFLMQACRARGIFDEENVRGVGVWRDGANYVLNLGDGLYYNGRRQALDSSRYFYEIGQRMPEPSSGDVDLSVLPSLCKKISWKQEQDNIFLLGALTVAPVAGALDWRPHVWLTGGAGTGKSTIMQTINALLGPYRYYFQGQTTEAGIRQTTNNDSKAVMLDEFESDSEKTFDRVNSILELCRQASSETEGHVAKGSPSGHAVSARPKFCAIMASIRVNLISEADRGRFKELELERTRDAEQFDQFKALAAQVTSGFAQAYFSRTFRLLPVLQSNIEIFWDVLRKRYTARIGQQYGALLAGAWLARNDTAVTVEEAELVCSTLHLEQQSIGDKEEVECLDHLANSLIALDYGMKKTVAELIEDFNLSADGKFEMELRRRGLKVKEGFLYVAATHPGLRAVYEKTRWNSGWIKSLCRLAGAVKKTERIDGKSVYCVAVPLGLVLENA